MVLPCGLLATTNTCVSDVRMNNSPERVLVASQGTAEHLWCFRRRLLWKLLCLLTYGFH